MSGCPNTLIMILIFYSNTRLLHNNEAEELFLLLHYISSNCEGKYGQLIKKRESIKLLTIERGVNFIDLIYYLLIT